VIHCSAAVIADDSIRQVRVRPTFSVVTSALVGEGLECPIQVDRLVKHLLE